MLSNFMSRQGQDFTIERNTEKLRTVKGMQNREPSTGRAYIGFFPGTDIKDGDWLINQSGDRFYVQSHQTQILGGKPEQLKAFYLTEFEYNEKQTSSAPQISIGTIHGSAMVGNQQNFTININSSLEELKELIATKPHEEQEVLNKLAKQLETILQENQPVKKGFLAQFRDVIVKHADVANTITNIFLTWATVQSLSPN